MVLLSTVRASGAFQQTFNRQQQYNQLSSQPIVPQQSQNYQNHQGHNTGHNSGQHHQTQHQVQQNQPFQQNQQYQQQNNRQQHSFGASQVK